MNIVIDVFKKVCYTLDTIKNIMGKIGGSNSAGFNRVKSVKPVEDPEAIYGIIPKNRTEPYDMMEIIKRMVDNSELEEYKAGYGKTLITGYARIDGWAVGIVANQRKGVKNAIGCRDRIVEHAVILIKKVCKTG